MRITPDELKYLARLNTAISIRAWSMGYALADTLKTPGERVTHIADYKRKLRDRRLSSGELKTQASIAL